MPPRGRNYKFPDAGDRSPNDPTVHCDSARIIALFNQETGGDAQRLSKTVRDWFAREAAEAGWTGVHFLADAQSQYGSGCVMYVDFNRSIRSQAAATPLLITDDLGE